MDDLAADIEVIVQELSPDVMSFLTQELQSIHNHGGPAVRLAMNALSGEVPSISTNITRKFLVAVAARYGKLNGENFLMFLASILRRRNAILSQDPGPPWKETDSA